MENNGLNFDCEKIPALFYERFGVCMVVTVKPAAFRDESPFSLVEFTNA
jgi:hypothetical protein